MAGYEPFHYGQEINQWRKLVDWDNPPPGMMDIDWRLDFYKRNLEKWSAICADDAGLTRQFNIRQQRRPTEQIYRFIKAKNVPPVLSCQRQLDEPQPFERAENLFHA